MAPVATLELLINGYIGTSQNLRKIDKKYGTYNKYGNKHVEMDGLFSQITAKQILQYLGTVQMYHYLNTENL